MRFLVNPALARPTRKQLGYIVGLSGGDDIADAWSEIGHTIGESGATARRRATREDATETILRLRAGGNPKGGTMARKLPPRDSRGRFQKTSRRRTTRRRSRSRRNPSKAAARRHAASMPRDSKGRFLPRGRSRRNPGRYSRNPVRGGIVDTITESTIAGVELVAGKAASRAVPNLLRLPEAGNVGVAIRAGTGLALGWAADMMGWNELGGRLVEGAFAGAVEDLVVGYNLPFLATALRREPGIVPAAGGGGTTGMYITGARTGTTGRYSRSRTNASRANGVGRYVQTPYLS